ncbi:galactokinase [Streptomyces sp. N2-109]|uniref:Galactokinase n=1 Tax=Streptomyces gossypii TaxID=2883101 RepID=A0ABT2JZB4_9ACTN|nr:galactokinase [Streptomyces gossypii]MCT2593036.1 galactokinase [Streptomyces gossypii]
MSAPAFEEVYGAAPDGVWAAPGRVNLIGEHTDYNDGFVMPLALPHTTRVHAARRDDGVLRLHSADSPGQVVELRLDALAPTGAVGWAAYPAGAAWALREAGLPVGGADLHFESTVPTGAGLSSSAALEVSTGLALTELHGPAAQAVTAPELARLCQRAENEFVGVPCGIMDQMASACCVEGHALFLDTRDLSRRQIPFDLAALGLKLLVVDTRVKHELGDGEYAKRRAGCEEGARRLDVRALRDVPYEELDAALARVGDRAGPGGAQGPELRALVRHIVTENHRVMDTVRLLEEGDTRAVGPLLTAGHASLRDDFAISCAELDLVVDTANAAGALGARMTGGGFGGSAIVLLDDALTTEVTDAIRTAFTTAGYRAPRTFEAIPSPGAHRLR